MRRLKKKAELGNEMLEPRERRRHLVVVHVLLPGKKSIEILTGGLVECSTIMRTIELQLT
jgi:hypothetical protein